MVAFSAIPGNLLVPLFYAEVNSGGTPFEGQSRLLLVGQKLTAGTATAAVPLLVQSETEAVALFGLGAMLVRMYRIARRNAPFQPIWVLPLADPAGAAATGTITVNTAPSTPGVAVFEICDERITFQVLASDTVTTIAASLVAAINAAGIEVTAANTLGVVTVTSRHVGTAGNGIDLFLKVDEPNILAGRVTIVGMASGTGVPSLTTPLANLGDDEFDWIAGAYADATSLNAIRDFLNDSAGRWSPSKMLYGHYVATNVGTLSANVTLGNARNDRHVSLMATQASPTPSWAWSAAIGAKLAQHLSDAPELSRPLHTLVLEGIRPPRDRSTWWAISDRQALYADGMSGYKVTVDGLVTIDRIVSTEQVNASSVPDATFRAINVLAQMMFFVRYTRAGVLNRFGRSALADENPAGLAEIATPRAIKAQLIHLYEEMVGLGVVEKPELFAQFVVVERDPNNADRVNAYLPADVVNQLNVFAANITAFAEYRR